MSKRLFELSHILTSLEFWLEVGDIYSTITDLYKALLFILVYVVCWKSIRSELLGRWTHQIARWILRIQSGICFLLIAAVIATFYDRPHLETYIIIISALTVFALLAMFHEMLIRKYGAREPVSGQCNNANSADTGLRQKIAFCLQCILLELRGLWELIRSDKDLKVIRIFLALFVSYVAYCVVLLPLMIISFIIFNKDNATIGQFVVNWAPLLSSFFAALFFDRWVKKKLFSKLPITVFKRMRIT